jgi:hypothetical protein
MTSILATALRASAAACGLALLSAVAGFGGGVLLLPVFTVISDYKGPGKPCAVYELPI